MDSVSSILIRYSLVQYVLPSEMQTELGSFLLSAFYDVVLKYVTKYVYIEAFISIY